MAKNHQRRRRVRREIFERDHFTCQDCGWQPVVPDDWNGTGMLGDKYQHLSIDHIIEKALGGPSTKENFRTLCSKCNTRRSLPVSRMIRKAQDRGMSLEEARRHVAIRLGYDVA